MGRVFSVRETGWRLVQFAAAVENTVVMMDDTEKSRDLPKVEVVRNLLRSHIVNGVYSPGSRLPTFVEMEGEFAVGRAVLQQALASLKRDGFVRSVNRQGLYVAANPPHMHQFGVVVSSSPGEAGWSKLMTALSNEAHRIEKHDPHAHFRFYFGIQEKKVHDEMIAQMRDDILAFRLAGLLLTPKTFHVMEHPSLVKLRIPRVHVWAGDEVPGPRVNVDSLELIRRALRFLRDRGRRRVAVIHMADTTSTLNHAALYSELGLDFHAPWIQRIGRSHPEFAQDVISLLMDYRFDVRPDGLIIADDNLVSPISRGLINRGIRVEQELEIVAHCNWPWPPPSVLPMTRIGFDIGEILHCCMNAIALQREGKAPPESQRIQPLFEHELPPNVLAEATAGAEPS